SAPPVTFDTTVPSKPTGSFPLGTSSVTLVVNDGQVDSTPATTHVTVQDTLPPAGSITFPANGACYGSAVTVQDSYADVCDPNVTRTYTPAPGVALQAQWQSWFQSEWQS